MLLYFFQINTRVYRVNGIGGGPVVCLICTTTVPTAEGLKSPLTHGGHFFAMINGTSRN